MFVIKCIVVDARFKIPKISRVPIPASIPLQNLEARSVAQSAHQRNLQRTQSMGSLEARSSSSMQQQPRPIPPAISSASSHSGSFMSAHESTSLSNQERQLGRFHKGNVINALKNGGIAIAAVGGAVEIGRLFTSDGDANQVRGVIADDSTTKAPNVRRRPTISTTTKTTLPKTRRVPTIIYTRATRPTFRTTTSRIHTTTPEIYNPIPDRSK